MAKVLILTVTAGNGHNSAANAVKLACEKRGSEAKVVNLLYEFCDNKAFTWRQDRGYALACTFLPKTFNHYFKKYQKRSPEKYYNALVQKNLFGMYAKLLKCVYSYQPDAIFCSHFLGAVMLSNLRKLYKIPPFVASFVSDFVVCPFWEGATGIDLLLSPNEQFLPTLEFKGYQKSQLLPIGIPVKEEFSQPLNKKTARKKLGLKEDVFTIFVMFGGGLWSGNFQIVKSIFSTIKDKQVQVVVANGADKKGKRKIDELECPKNITLFNFGFCNNVQEIMSAADVLVGKAGGISVSEALNKHLPLVCGSRLPQQEICNIKMLKNLGAAKQYKNKKQLGKILRHLCENPQELEKMSAAAASISKPNATQTLANKLCACKADYSGIDVKSVDYGAVDKNIKTLLKKHKGNVEEFEMAKKR